MNFITILLLAVLLDAIFYVDATAPRVGKLSDVVRPDRVKRYGGYNGGYGGGYGNGGYGGYNNGWGGWGQMFGNMFGGQRGWGQWGGNQGGYGGGGQRWYNGRPCHSDCSTEEKMG